VRAEIVGVGTELLLGQIANTNARWMSERLAESGVDVLRHQTVGDNFERIVETLRLAAQRADVVLVTGGLGPTEDDITRDAIAELTGTPMMRHPELVDLLRAKFSGMGRQMPENNLRQADVPEGARVIVPVRGTAPGLIADLAEGSRLYAMPGVPDEMVEMMEATVLPELRSLQGGRTIVSRTIRCVGIGESRVAELLSDLFLTLQNPTVAYLASTGEVKVRLTSSAASTDEAEHVIEPIADEVIARLGDTVFTTQDEELEEVVVRLLDERGLGLALAESLTGGGVGTRITDVPGASRWFRGSAVVYTAEAKADVLGVNRATLEGPGAVSEACAREMAAGARKLFASDLALALTGAAGPEPHGGAEPGTVWLALDSAELQHARGYVSAGERDRVRRWAEQAGLDLIRRFLQGKPLPGSDDRLL
jgi:nicotinamide-nucleotide amidase